MEMVFSNIMRRRTKYGNLKVVVEVVGCDVDLLAIVKGLDGGVIEDDEEVGKKLLNEF